MNELTKNEKIANIIAFLLIMFNENQSALESIIEFPPDYIIEKFERYVLSSRVEYPWGLHPSLRNNLFHNYIDKWELELKDELFYEVRVRKI